MEEVAEKKNIGILGGTFNPVHCGHIRMAQVALKSGLIDTVAFLPLSIAPHKDNMYIADKEDRYNMLMLAIKNEDKFQVWRDEIDREGYTYTIDSLKILKNKFPQCNFIYIIGSDTVFELYKWKNASEIFQLCEFLVIFRPGTDIKAVKDKIIEYEKEYGAKIRIIEEKGYKAESSAIRVALINGEDTENVLPSAVYNYIIKHKLYGEKNE